MVNKLSRLRTSARTVAVLLSLLVSITSVRSADAQEIYGTLREAVSARPVVGVLVVVSLASNDSVIARTTTNERGVYLVRANTEPLVLRAHRIGQLPVEFARTTLAAGKRRELSAELPDRPVQVIAVDVRAESRCRNEPVDGSRAAQLFADARTALLASRVAASTRPATSVFRLVAQRYSTRERPIGDPTVREDTLGTLQPFRANDVTQLLDEGFFAQEPDNSLVFSAPDAELLTDDRFLTHYCLRLASESPTDPPVIGVTFEPARTRGGIVQVRGTLWLDRRSQELRSVEYGYRGLEASQARVAPGGAVEYTRLDNGVWFVSDWSIRMPVMVAAVRRVSGISLPYTAVNGIQITSGHVTFIHEDGELVFASGEPFVPQDSEALAQSVVSLRDSVYCETVSEDTLVTLHGELRDSTDAPMAGVLVRARWTEIRRSGDISAQNTSYVEFERQLFATVGADGQFELCDLPRGVKIELLAGPADRPVARTTLRLRKDATESRIVLRAR